LWPGATYRASSTTISSQDLTVDEKVTTGYAKLKIDTQGVRSGS
jgi:hypothetical protein